MPPGFLLRASTISTSMATTTHHLILGTLGLCPTKVLPIQLSLSLKQDCGLVFWLCQLSAVAHLLRGEDGEQLKLKTTVTALRRLLDAPEMLRRRRRSFGGAICVTATIVSLPRPLFSEFPPLINTLLMAWGQIYKGFPLIMCNQLL